MPADKPTELSRIKLKTWTRQPVPMISEHSAHSTPQPFGIRPWLWRYTCLLLLISMLWHRQAIFESKGDKLSSSAECRIRTHQSHRHQIASVAPVLLSQIARTNIVTNIDRQPHMHTHKQTNKLTNTQGENIITSLSRVIIIVILGHISETVHNVSSLACASRMIFNSVFKTHDLAV